MKIYIDTNTFSATPNLYADAEKTKILPRQVPAVELERGTLEVAFLGDNRPTDDSTLAIAARIENTRTQILAGYGSRVADTPEPTWAFRINLGAQELVNAIASRGTVRIKIGIIAETENVRTEWQFAVSVGASASAEVNDEQVDSAKNWAEYIEKQIAEFSENLEGLKGYPTFNDIRNGIETQSVTGFDPNTQGEIGNGILLARETLVLQSGGEEVLVPAKSGAIAFTEDVQEKVPLLETVPPAADNNAEAFGYVGTLRALGAFGGAVLVSRLSVFNRASGNIQNGNVSIWARILKIVDGAWVVAAQSENSIKWNDYGYNAEIPFKMLAATGITPPSADETIAIVFVNSASAAAGASNGKLSFRTITLHGGIANTLNAPDNLNAGNSWSPRIKLRFAPLAGTEQYATADALIEALEGVDLSNYLPISGGTLTGALTLGSLTIDANGGFTDSSGGVSLAWRIIGDAAKGGATLAVSAAHYNFPESNGDFTVATLEDLEEYAKKSDISDNSSSTDGSSSSGGYGLDVDNMTTETSSEWTYDEATEVYSTAIFKLASADGYVSCTATQNSESETANKVHLQFSLGTADGGTAVVCENSANGYGDMASIFVPVASGTFYLINATSNEPATITMKFFPLKSSAATTTTE